MTLKTRFTHFIGALACEVIVAVFASGGWSLPAAILFLVCSAATTITAVELGRAYVAAPCDQCVKLHEDRENLRALLTIERDENRMLAEALTENDR